MTTRCAIILALILSMIVPAAMAQESPEAQDSGDRTSVEGGAGFFAIGTHRGGFGALDDRLDAAGYPTFGAQLLSLGGGGYSIVGGRFLIGGEGHGLIGPSRSFQGRDLTLGGGYGLATFGYLVVARSGWQVYPQIGAGLGGFSVEIGSDSGAGFDDVLDAPNREARLNRGAFLMSLALHATYTVWGEGSSGVRVGLQTGYLLEPARSDWTLGGHTLTDGPDAGLDGLFIRLLVGGGGLH